MSATSRSAAAQPSEEERRAAWAAYYAAQAAQAVEAAHDTAPAERQRGGPAGRPAEAERLQSQSSGRTSAGPPTALPHGWTTGWAAEYGCYYYCNAALGLTQWEPPAAASSSSAAQNKRPREAEEHERAKPAKAQPRRPANLFEAFDQGPAAVKEALKTCTDINAFGPHGKTALHLACQNGDAPIAVQLLHATPSPHVNMKSHDGFTALHLAVLADDKNIVKMLIDSEADPIVPNSNGETPMVLASKIGNKAIMKMVSDAVFAKRDVNRPYKKELMPLIGKSKR